MDSLQWGERLFLRHSSEPVDDSAVRNGVMLFHWDGVGHRSSCHFSRVEFPIAANAAAIAGTSIPHANAMSSYDPRGGDYRRLAELRAASFGC
jgi:hypothetical protein